MSLAKAVFSGKVFREPQKRSTSNNVPITYFTFDIGTQNNEELIRVRAIGNMAEEIEKQIVKNDRLAVEGTLSISTIKTETGAEKRIVDLTLSSYEKIIDSSNNSNLLNNNAQNEDIIKFSADTPDELIGEDEIPF